MSNRARHRHRRGPGGVLLGLMLCALILAPAAFGQYDDDRQREPRDYQLRTDDNVDIARGRLDLNRATLEQMKALPIPLDVATNIYFYRTYQGFFKSIYDVAEVDGVTPVMLKTLLPLVATLPPDPKDEAALRYDLGFQQVQRFLSQEGASEELADEYLDRLREPRNINDLSLYELQSFQNVSPVDAVAIINARDRSGAIQSQRQLRSSDGLSYWGFRNLRDYVIYDDDDEEMKLHGDFQFVSFNTPYLLDDSDILIEPVPGLPQGAPDFETGTPWGIRGLDSATPAVLGKLRLRLGNQWKAGLMTFRDVGEADLNETMKGFVSWRNPSRANLKLDEVVLGNYRVAFGQGLVMDNTDFFLPRKTGFGFNKRPVGVMGDVGRSQEFALRGAAAEATWGRLHGTGFVSHGKKDGIINPDGSINKYIVMAPRFEEDELELIGAGLQRDAFEETVFGGNLKYQIVPGTYVGVSGYEAKYDEVFDPDVGTIVDREDLLDPRDNELLNAYDSRQLGKFRRVVGAEFQAVYENVAFQGEYAKLDANPDGTIFNNAPDAFLLNGYVQYGDLNFFALYRDYDVGFDNPYARGFSNDTKYEQTLLSDPFRLESPLFTWLEINNPQMKAERGIFLTTRYRVTDKLTINGLDYDQWTRVADGQSQRRYTARFEYAPIFPLRFRLRQRFSSRSEEGVADFRRFRSWDSRLEMRVRLSGYDELRLLYSATSTEFVPRGRLSYGPEPGDVTPLAQAASPSQALQAMLTHNVNDRLTLAFSTQLYNGFLWNFEDNEFVVVDGEGIRNWVLLRSRLSDSLLMRFKFTTDHMRSRSNLDLRAFEQPAGFLNEGDNIRQRMTSFRLQLDYTF